MKTLEYVIEKYKSETIDGRDLNRLAEFVEEKDLSKIGVILKEEYIGTWEKKEFTKENIMAQLKKDVEFGFEKALSQRGISASAMYGVVQMWNWILEDGLEDENKYAQYGLPLFKATAIKYGFDNPIGEDDGDELDYS